MKSFEYKMPAKFAAEVLKNTKKKNKSDVQKVLCDYVNEQFVLLYPCTKVIVE